QIEEEQEFLMATADLAILLFAWESALLRARQLIGRYGEESAGPVIDLARLFGDWAADQAELTARRALAGMEHGDTLQTQLALLRRLFRRTPVNSVELGRRVAQRVLTAGRYVVLDMATE
ncbi:MAG: acyl-CoA dehydrogenase, partial [Dehalococcoidia bacterium]